MKCTQCKQPKPEREFYTKNVTKAGVKRKYKKCMKCTDAQITVIPQILDKFTLAGRICF